MHKYFVSGNQQITPSTVFLTLTKRLGSEPLLFQPGQYAAINFIRDGRPSPARCFSIVSSPTNSNELQFSMRVKGRFTKAISQVRSGDEIDVRGPYGSFTYDVNQDKELVFVAGGIGITPFMSMLQYAVDKQLTNKITLIYGCRTQDDVPFGGTLEALAQKNPNIRIIYVVSDGPVDKLPQGRVGTGRVTADIMKRVMGGVFAGKKYMICGPSIFMRAITKILNDNNVSDDSIITEAFTQGKRKHGRTYKWPMNIYIVGTVGIALGSFAIMIKDLLDTLPPTSTLGSASDANSTSSSNSRQYDLDQLVNELPTTTNMAPATSAAQEAANTNAANNSSASSQAQTTSVQPVVTPAPKPAPAPKCTTSQSGVTTCV